MRYRSFENQWPTLRADWPGLLCAMVAVKILGSSIQGECRRSQTDLPANREEV
jgi:hypothetical protein